MTSTPSNPPPPPPLHLTIRFTTTQPDLPLHIPSPHLTTPVHLKQLIRSALPPNLSTHRLRLIHAGRPLADNVPLTQLLKYAPPPPPPPSASRSIKGKERATPDTSNRPIPGASKKAPIYIHCSIGPVLPSTALVQESDSATSLTASLTDAFNNRSITSTSTTPHSTTGAATPSPDPTTGAAQTSNNSNNNNNNNDSPTPDPSTTPRPLGFDRLLTAGFTQSEIQTLRSHFLALLSHTHTPDNLPSPQEMRLLEDRWLDNSTSGADALAGISTTTTTALGEDEDGEAGGLDDMLWGTLMGFFWPVGAGVWVCREEGVWTRRRKVAVLAGCVVSFVFGLFRVTS
ncbi:MAG: hypothetical protein M1834_003181 [Cirrosporium novae-zelandiae]|nr:MAG: hypothetical protein M1834_003181 [Cirrosporium novae-zelandiae]